MTSYTQLKKYTMKKGEFNKIKNSNKITHCYIYKRGYYRPDSCGYTDFTYKAGVYTKEEALSHCENSNEVIAIPINIEEHNLRIMEEIKDLASRIIKPIK